MTTPPLPSTTVYLTRRDRPSVKATSHIQGEGVTALCGAWCNGWRAQQMRPPAVCEACQRLARGTRENGRNILRGDG